MLFFVRYRDEVIHPDHFKGRGFYGFCIRACNWLRWKVEVFVHFLVLKSLIKEGVFDKEKAGTLTRMFGLDVREEKIQKERLSPTLLPVEDYDIPDILPERAESYKQGRATSKLESTQMRPKPLDELAARYSTGKRQRRYSRGHRFSMMDPDGDFEAIEIK